MGDSIEEAAAERRARLQALRDAQKLLNTPDEPDAQQQDGDEDEDADADQQHNEVAMKFRNYLPQDKQLQEGKLAPPVLPKFQDPAAAAPNPPPEESKEDPFLNIAPKKPNWDLRRDVQKRLDKLEKRTQKAKNRLMMEQEEARRRLAEESADGEEQVD